MRAKNQDIERVLRYHIRFQSVYNHVTSSYAHSSISYVHCNTLASIAITTVQSYHQLSEDMLYKLQNVLWYPSVWIRSIYSHHCTKFIHDVVTAGATFAFVSVDVCGIHAIHKVMPFQDISIYWNVVWLHIWANVRFVDKISFKLADYVLEYIVLLRSW